MYTLILCLIVSLPGSVPFASTFDLFISENCTFYFGLITASLSSTFIDWSVRESVHTLICSICGQSCDTISLPLELLLQLQDEDFELIVVGRANCKIISSE